MNPDDKIDLYTLIRNIRWRYQLDQFESGALTEVLKSVEQAKKEILLEFAKPKKYADINSWTDSRNEELLKELDQLTVGIKTQIGADVTQLAEIAYTKSLDVHNDIFSMGGKALNVNMLQYAPEQIKAFLAEPVGGMLLSEWVNETYDYPLQKRLKTEMLAGQFRGEGYPKLAKRVNELLGDAADNTTTMVRTWVHSANVAAQHNVMKENADIITGWKWNATLENGNFGKGRGTCLTCLALDAREEIYPINGGPPLPAHPRCRCLRIPKTKSWRDLGIPIDDLESETRPYTIRGEMDPITGKVTRGNIDLGGKPIISAGKIKGGMNGFFKSLDEDVQRQTLGPRRFELWKAGKLDLGGLVDDTGRLRLVKEIEGGVGKYVKPVKPGQGASVSLKINISSKLEKETFEKMSTHAYSVNQYEPIPERKIGPKTIKRANEQGLADRQTGEFQNYYTPALQVSYNEGFAGRSLQNAEIVRGIRYGKSPDMGISYNFTENIPEKGLSLAQEYGKKEIGSSMWFKDRKAYEYEGLKVGTGSDGETIIIPFHVEYLD